MNRMWGLSLFSGIGGLDLAFEWAGGVISAFCEIEPYCQKVLHKHWPNVPLFEDIKELRGSDVPAACVATGAVDVIYGEFAIIERLCYNLCQREIDSANYPFDREALVSARVFLKISKEVIS